MSELYQVIVPHFVAGLDAKQGRVTRAAPILQWAVGKRLEDVRRWAERKGGKLDLVVPMRSKS